MRQIEINDVFIQEYLTCGATYDNHIFENCPIELINEAKKLLVTSYYGIKPCNVKFTRDDEIKVEKTLENCTTEFQRDILARDFVTALVMKEVIKDIPEKGMHHSVVREQIKAFYTNEFWRVKQLHATSFFPREVAEYSKKFGKIEVNFFLIDNQNIVIQKAINNFISSRSPYSVKVFTTNEKLPSYLDQGGNLIQAPHDYLNVNPHNFITLGENNLLDLT